MLGFVFCSDFAASVPAVNATVSAHPTPPPGPWRSRLARLWLGLRWLWRRSRDVLLVLVLLALLCWLWLWAYVAPNIGRYQPQLEAYASAQLGQELRIAQVSANRRYLPSLVLDDVRLLDAQGNTALALARVQIDWSWRHVWRGRPSRLLLQAPTVPLERHADGSLWLGQWRLDGDGNEPTALKNWLFGLPHLQLQDGRLSWHDATLPAPRQSLALKEVALTLRYGTGLHRLDFHALPDGDWAEQPVAMQAQFRQSLTQPLGDWHHWRGWVDVQLPLLRLDRLPAYPLPKLRSWQAHGAANARLHMAHGVPQGLELKARLPQLQWQHRDAPAPVALADVQLHAKWQQLATGQRLDISHLTLRHGQQQWPASQWQLRTKQDGEGQWQGGELALQQVKLGQVAALALALPLPPEWQQRLQQWQPEGELVRLRYQWQGPLPAPNRYAVSGQIRELGMAAGTPTAAEQLARPGLAGAQLDFDANQSGGRATLAMQSGWLEFPGVFAQPRMALERLAGDVEWRINGRGEKQGLVVTAKNIHFANVDAAGSAEAVWRSLEGSGAERFPGHLDLRGQIERAEGPAVWRYLPLALPDSARDYVQAAIRAGTGRQGRFVVQGKLDDIPSKEPGRSTFLIAAHITGAQYDFAPQYLLPAGSKPWPVLEDLTGELVFDGYSMAVRQASGRSGGLALRQLEANIADWDTLQVAAKGQLSGDLNAALGVLRQTAVGDLLSGALQQAQGSGPSHIGLELELPIEDLEHAKVKGSVQLTGNGVRLHPKLPLLSQARGQVRFNEHGFVLDGVTAQGLGGPVRIQGGMGPLAGAAADDHGVHLQARGQLQATALQAQTQVPELAAWAQHLSGSSRYAIGLDVADEALTLKVQSDLQGLAIALPPPLQKSADSRLPLLFQQSQHSLAGQPHSVLSAELGQVLALQYAQPQDGDGPVRGALRVGHGSGLPALPKHGVQAQLQLAQLPLADWLALTPKLAKASAPSSSANSKALARYLPTQVRLRTDELALAGRSLHQVQLQAEQRGAVWHVAGQSQEASGWAEYTPAQHSAAHPHGHLKARLQRLHWGPAQSQAMQQRLQQSAQSLPALDVVVEQLQVQGRPLGRLELAADSADAGRTPGRVWHLRKLQLDLPEAKLQGSGQWRNTAANDLGHSELRLHWDIRDAGALLERLGQTGVLAKGQGQLHGTVRWPGGITHIEPSTMTGQLALDIHKGRLLKADPGAAKLLGVLNLQALPRRLTLDFGDVFAKGFSFDVIRGDIAIDQGLASTNNLQMAGVNAAVLLEGVADLKDETQDVQVLIVPEINAGSAALVATAINPAVGIGAFVAQWLLSKPVNQAATRKLRITGSWRAPQVTVSPKTPPATRPQSE